MPPIPLFSARAVNASLDLLSPLRRVVESQWFVLGEEVAAFEREFAAYCGVPHCVSVANGTDALEFALRAAGVRSGDTVALAANAGFYGSIAVHQVGAVPLYVDVDPATLTLSPERFREALARHPKPKAAIVTHLYGQLAAIEEIAAAAAPAGVAVIEDCAQAHGARRGGRLAGSFGDLACFSFYPTKNLGALGDGGAVVAREKETAETLRRLRQYGWGAKYAVGMPGGRNSRLDELQAAVLREKLPRLDSANARRREIARRYNTAFAGTSLLLPSSTEDDFVAHLYVVRTRDRDAFRAGLAQREIHTDIHYPLPDHLQEGYPCAQKAGSLPVSEEACRQAVSLPCFPGLPDADVERVVAAVLSVV